MNASTPLPTTPESLFALLHGQRGREEDVALLCADGSMTQALAARFGTVRVLRTAEGWQLLGAGEARLLARPCRGGSWCREILLLAAGRVRLRARTVIPADAQCLQRAVRRLGDRPLMDLLFLGRRLRPGVARTQRCFGRDRDGNLARVTLFTVAGEPLLLRETLADERAPANVAPGV
ncbi:MAG: chorismate lyase [Gammaproteobacteria bacterium]|nr:chorismate lyase [Gammaproteobacteria bacterium]